VTVIDSTGWSGIVDTKNSSLADCREVGARKADPPQEFFPANGG